MLAPLWALVALFLGRWLALAAAAAALSVVAAAVDGRPLDPERAWHLAAGPALVIALAWALQAWRAQAADLALGALGHRPSLAVLTVAGLAGAAGLAVAPPPARADRAAIFSDGRAVFHLADGPLVLTWQGPTAHGARAADWPGLPRPVPVAQAPTPPSTPAALWVIGATAALVGLGPRLSAFAAAGAAAALWGVGALLAGGWA